MKENAAPYCVRWVRRFLTRPAANEPLAVQVRHFCDDLEREGTHQACQIRQAEQALHIYLVNFLQRTYWHQRPPSTTLDEEGRVDLKLPFNERKYKQDLRVQRLYGESGYTTLERVWARPTFEVTGLLAGFAFAPAPSPDSRPRRQRTRSAGPSCCPAGRAGST